MQINYHKLFLFVRIQGVSNWLYSTVWVLSGSQQTSWLLLIVLHLLPIVYYESLEKKEIQTQVVAMVHLASKRYCSHILQPQEKKNLKSIFRMTKNLSTSKPEQAPGFPFAQYGSLYLKAS